MSRVWGAIAFSLLLASCTDHGNADPLRGTHGALEDLSDRWEWLPREPLEMDWDPPAQAAVLAGGGELDPSDASDRQRVGPRELDLQSAGRVQADRNAGTWVLTGGRLGTRSGITVLRLSEDHVGPIYPFEDVTGMVIGPDRTVYLSGNSSPNIGVLPPDRIEQRLAEVEVVAESLAADADGTLYVGARREPRIVALGSGGETRDLLSAPVWDGPARAGRIALLTLLGDGRVAFAAKGVEDDFTLWVIQDDGQTEPVGDDIEVASRQMVSTIAPAPDGDILVTTGDEIETVDVETGARSTIVDLSGAEGTFSATAVGDDLVFLADGRIWRMDGALAG